MMTEFWIYAVLLAVIAAGFVLLPVMIKRRAVQQADRVAMNVAIYEERLAELEKNLAEGEIDQPQFELLKLEQQRNLLIEAQDGSVDHPDDAAPQAGSTTDSRTLPIVFACLVPVFAVLAYADFGLSWGSIADVELAKEMNGGSPHDTEGIAGSVDKLAERLKSQPDNDEAWFMLSQSYMKLERYEDAAGAFSHLIGRYPQDPGLASWYAEAIFMADARQMTPRVVAAIDKTLAMNPHDVSMLEIKAMDAFQKGDMQTAVKYFRKALQTGLEGERADLIRQAIARLETEHNIAPEVIAPDAMMSGQATGPMQTAAAKPSQSPAGNNNTSTVGQREIQVLVEKGDQVVVDANARVFVFARAVKGPPMPLAVKQFTVSGLPQLVKLDESMAMMPGMGLANFDQVQVVARISSSGIANASPDDYEVKTGPVDLTGKIGVLTLKIEKKIKDQ